MADTGKLTSEAGGRGLCLTRHTSRLGWMRRSTTLLPVLCIRPFPQIRRLRHSFHWCRSSFFLRGLGPGNWWKVPDNWCDSSAIRAEVLQISLRFPSWPVVVPLTIRHVQSGMVLDTGFDSSVIITEVPLKLVLGSMGVGASRWWGFLAQMTRTGPNGALVSAPKGPG